MSSLAKLRIVQAVVLAVAIWPAFHYVLSARLDFDPWELFGWAMYAVPQPRYQLAVERDDAGELTAFLPAGPLRREHRRIAARRGLLGVLQPIDGYAQQVLDFYDEADAVVIVERRWFLDHDTARLDHRDTRHRYDRYDR